MTRRQGAPVLHRVGMKDTVYIRLALGLDLGFGLTRVVDSRWGGGWGGPGEVTVQVKVKVKVEVMGNANAEVEVLRKAKAEIDL